MTAEEFLIALAVRQADDLKKTLDNLLNREVLVFKDGKYYVTQHWSEVIDEILCDSSQESDEERLKNLAQKMMECYPQGKMPGTAYYYRCNNAEIRKKLKKFFLQYGDYPDNEIIDATKRFVASYNGVYRYLPLLKYFISKNKSVMDEDGENHVSEVSELASYLENKEEEQVVVTTSDDWMLNVIH